MSKYQPVNRDVYRARATSLKISFRDNLEAIRNDNSLTESGKQSQIARAYNEALAGIENARAEEERHASERREYLEADLFGITPLSGGADLISYRDAYDRVADIPQDGAQDTALRLLTQAERSHDSHLAKAVIQRAMEEEWTPVLNRYAETRAGTEHKLQELFDMTAGTSTTFGLMAGFVAEGTYSLPVPIELRNLTQAGIQDVAAGRDATDDWQRV